MNDIVVEMIRKTYGKEARYSDVCISGVLAGIGVQKELVMAGKVFNDGSLVATLTGLAEKKSIAMLRELGDEYESLLFEGLFVGWEDKGEMARDYFTCFGMGMGYVCKLYEEFTTAGVVWPDIIAKITLVVDARMIELRKMI